MNKKSFIFILMLVSFSLSTALIFSQGSQEGEDKSDNEERIANEDFSDYPELKSSLTADNGREGVSEFNGLWDQIVPMDQALSAARSIHGAADRTTGAELAVEDGNVVYDIEFSDSTIVILDAANKKVLYNGKILDQEDHKDYNDNEEDMDAEEK